METTHLTPAHKHTAGTQPPSPRWPAWGGLSRVALFLGLTALLLLPAAPTLAASGSRTSLHGLTRPVNSATCQVKHVTLHGTLAPTISCLRQKRAGPTRSTGGSGPLASLAFASDCADDALALYWDGPIWSSAWWNSPELCISGYGLLNLTDVGWNDVASAWWTGCRDDYFYQNINRGGGIAYAPGSPDGENSANGNFPYGGVGNDQLSSIWQFNFYGGDLCY